jgi:phosphoribosylformylglycinamidine synthase subunit PurSL
LVSEEKINTCTKVPDVDLNLSKKTFDIMNKIIDKELIESLHDCSDGGFAGCISEMAFAGKKGAMVDISEIPTLEKKINSTMKMFSESQTRFVAEIRPINAAEFEKKLTIDKIPFAKIGTVSDSKNLTIKDNGKILVNVDTLDLEKSFKNTEWNSL